MFSERLAHPLSFPPSLHPVCQSKGQSPDGSLYHKEKHKRTSAVSRLTGKWDFRRDLNKTWNYQHRECMFSRGYTLSKKRERIQQSIAKRQKWVEIGLNNPLLYVILLFNTLWTLCLLSAYSSMDKARHLAQLYGPFSVWLNGFNMVLSVEGEGFDSLCSAMARAVVLTWPQMRV